MTGHIESGTLAARAIYSADGQLRRFAQELLMQDAVEIWNLIESKHSSNFHLSCFTCSYFSLKEGAHIYVCGSAVRLGAGVRKSITQIARQVGAVEDPDSFVPWMIKNGRFSEDVFGLAS